MHDPKFIPSFLAVSALDRCYRPGGIREFPRDSPEGIRKSLSRCHDVNQKLILANDELRRLVLKLENNAHWERAWRWGIVAGVVIAVIAAFALHFAYL